MERLLT